MAQLRFMRSQDLNAVMGIERNAQLSPWSRLSFEESLNREHRCRVLEQSDQIIGYSIVCDVADELHVLNIVVAQPHQGKGNSHYLMQDVFDFAQSQDVSAIFLEVRVSNAVAQQLYERWGFERIYVRKRYYQALSKDAEREDASIMCRRLSE